MSNGSFKINNLKTVQTLICTISILCESTIKSIVVATVFLGACHYAKLAVRDQWKYLRKMERHFPIKSGQPVETALVILILLPNYLIRAKDCQNGLANFGRNIPTEICGPPPEVILSIPVRITCDQASLIFFVAVERYA